MMPSEDESPLGLISFSILFSLILHALFLILGSWGFSIKKEPPKQQQEQVQWIDLSKDLKTMPKDLKDRQVVDVFDQENIVDQNEDAPYLSDENRKVQKQTQGSPSNRQSKPTPQKQASKNLTTNDLLNLSDAALSKILEDTPPVINMTFNANNYLPGMEDGEKTMLSTKKFAYAEFYNRMRRDLIWNPSYNWVKGKSKKQEWITTVLIVLDREGDLVKHQLLESSGISVLDQSVMDSVETSQPFRNPPEELIDTAGQIRMTWNFIFNAQRRPWR